MASWCRNIVKSIDEQSSWRPSIYVKSTIFTLSDIIETDLTDITIGESNESTLPSDTSICTEIPEENEKNPAPLIDTTLDGNSDFVVSKDVEPQPKSVCDDNSDIDLSIDVASHSRTVVDGNSDLTTTNDVALHTSNQCEDNSDIDISIDVASCIRTKNDGNTDLATTNDVAPCTSNQCKDNSDIDISIDVASQVSNREEYLSSDSNSLDESSKENTGTSVYLIMSFFFRVQN